MGLMFKLEPKEAVKMSKQKITSDTKTFLGLYFGMMIIAVMNLIRAFVTYGDIIAKCFRVVSIVNLVGVLLLIIFEVLGDHHRYFKARKYLLIQSIISFWITVALFVARTIVTIPHSNMSELFLLITYLVVFLMGISLLSNRYQTLTIFEEHERRCKR
jgi:hypothetical protein